MLFFLAAFFWEIHPTQSAAEMLVVVISIILASTVRPLLNHLFFSFNFDSQEVEAERQRRLLALTGKYVPTIDYPSTRKGPANRGKQNERIPESALDALDRVEVESPDQRRRPDRVIRIGPSPDAPGSRRTDLNAFGLVDDTEALDDSAAFAGLHRPTDATPVVHEGDDDSEDDDDDPDQLGIEKPTRGGAPAGPGIGETPTEAQLDPNAGNIMFLYGHMADQILLDDDNDGAAADPAKNRGKKTKVKKAKKEKHKKKGTGAPTQQISRRGTLPPEMIASKGGSKNTLQEQQAEFPVRVPSAPAGDVSPQDVTMTGGGDTSSETLRKIWSRHSNRTRGTLLDDEFDSPDLGEDFNDGDGEGGDNDDEHFGMWIRIIALNLRAGTVTFVIIILAMMSAYYMMDKLQKRGDCPDFPKLVIIAVAVDLFFFQQIFLALVFLYRFMNSNEYDQFYAELHPFTGDVREY